jgi:hypothetical protein
VLSFEDAKVDTLSPSPWAEVDEQSPKKKKKKKVKPITMSIDEEEAPVTEAAEAPVTPTKKAKKAKVKEQKTPESQKKTPDGFKTPEQNSTIKTPSSVGNTPLKFVTKGMNFFAFSSSMVVKLK